MSDRGKLRKTVLQITEGIVSTLTDLVLLQIFFGFELTLASDKSPSSVHWAAENAQARLADINYQKIKQTIYYLKKRGLVKYLKTEKILKPLITAEGKKRLKEIVPTYDKKRVWDKKIYLITYDIPEIKKKDRDNFRYYLEKIGCGMLQASVWLTPYNPKEVLKEYIYQKDLQGQVIISDLGEDGSIGDENLKELIARVYDIDEINAEYFEFVQKWGNMPNDKLSEKAGKLVFKFLSILKKDPQLPFELLPEDWLGDKAYSIFQKAEIFCDDSGVI